MSLANSAAPDCSGKAEPASRIQLVMKLRIYAAVAVVALAVMAGCSSQPVSQDKVRERAADTTAALKRDSRSIAQGIKEGWNRDKLVDVNSASKEQLEALPGIDAPRATLIIRNRPYPSGDALVTKKVLSQQEYEKIADKIRTH